MCHVMWDDDVFRIFAAILPRNDKDDFLIIFFFFVYLLTVTVPVMNTDTQAYAAFVKTDMMSLASRKHWQQEETQ